ncbi:GNAT family N-acetyltransferase [Tsuneonella sp. HG222]
MPHAQAEPLLRPLWAALNGAQAHLAESNGRARRFRPSVNAFVAAEDDCPGALADVAALVPPGEKVYTVQADPVPDIPGLTTLLRRPGVQMVFAGGLPAYELDGIVPLGEPDAEDMLALATLTEPGPFRPETWLMGQFYGVRRGGRLLAMAGERMRLPGHSEVSGVCTHPDGRGLGLATRLSAHVTQAILDRGETPMLHVWKDNRPAIGVYERLGFRILRDMAVAMFERAEESQAR